MLPYDAIYVQMKQKTRMYLLEKYLAYKAVKESMKGTTLKYHTLGLT